MSDAAPPILMQWHGDHFTPAGPSWQKRCDKAFAIGGLYTLVEHQERSDASHRHYFALVNETWKNLPERFAEQFPTAEHLRKYCLIKAGYCDTHTLVCSSKAEALRVAGFMRPVDEFAVVTAKDATVTRYVAKSQSMRAMGREDFQRSKDDVIGLLADMLGVEPQALGKQKEAA